MVSIVPQREQIVTNGFPTLRFINFLEELSRTTNNISNELESGVAQTQGGETDELTSSLPIQAIGVSGDYTTIGSELLLCEAGAIVTLNDTPSDRETVVVNSPDGAATVDGNGRSISGQDSHELIEPNVTLAFVYALDSDSWVLTQSAHPETQQRLRDLRIDVDQFRVEVDILRADADQLREDSDALRVDVDVNSLNIGELPDLITINKADLVAAINEVSRSILPRTAFAIYAERATGRSREDTEWSYGGGDETPTGHGIVLPFDCELFAFSLNHEGNTGVTVLGAYRNTTEIAATLTIDGVESGYEVFAEPQQYTAGDIFNFKTISKTVNGESRRAGAWFRLVI